MFTSEDILSRRKTLNALAARHATMRHAHGELTDISFDLSEEVKKALLDDFVGDVSPFEDSDDRDFVALAERHLFETRKFSLFDSVLLQLICDSSVDQRNLIGNLKGISANLADIDPLPLSDIPVLTGWLDGEVAAVVRSYDGRIRRLTNNLRAVHQNMMRLKRARAAIPECLRESVTGFFGRGDFINHRYEDYEFKRYGSVEQRDHHGSVSFVEQRTPMMSTKWWYPLIGSAADPIDGAIATLFETSAPLPDEPPVPEFTFSANLPN